MPIRKLVVIDEEKCDGCGLCATACHEGAIQIIDGKARLVSESYCDGLGDCLGECPRGAITIEEREAAPYDQKAVDAHLAALEEDARPAAAQGGGCPGAAVTSFEPAGAGRGREAGGAAEAGPDSERAPSGHPSRLAQWPVQLMLVPVDAPFLSGADVLITADCVPFASNDFHDRYLAGRKLLVGCPKFDDVGHYYDKLKQMFAEAQPRSITVLRMQVPCCGGLASLVTKARNEIVPETELSIVTIGIRGELVSEERVESPGAA
jgi:Fe-S-cluster-containing hydrogenase component 2